MSEVKHQFDGIAKASSTMILVAMSGSPMAFLTRGLLGKITMFFLHRIMNSLANQGLAVLNIGVDALRIAQEKRTFEREIEEALKKVQSAKRKLTPKEMRDIDEPVKNAFRKFARFV